MLPEAVRAELREHLGRRRELYEKDLRMGRGSVFLPHALERKLSGASKEWVWRYVFVSRQGSRDPRSGAVRRHHPHEAAVSREIGRAVKSAGVRKRSTSHSLRHSFATHLLEGGHVIRTIRELIGHESVGTTMAYTHVLNRGGRGVRSPLDG